MTRLWVDANVLLRFLTRDPAPLAERSEQLILRAERGEVELFVTPLVIAEVIWVLKSFYGRSLVDISRVLVALLSADGLVMEDRDMAIRAVELVGEKNVDFADALLALQAAAHGETVCTFDETDFRRLPAPWIAP